MKPSKILEYKEHRPFPLPQGPWVMQQTWDDLLFMHWAVPPWLLKQKLQPPIELDTYNGNAYIAITPFKMRNVKFRFAPPVPTATEFLETNLRTYVTCKGKPGIHFFSLDASSLLAVLGARAGFLPYYRAAMRVKENAGEFDYRLSRGKARLHVRYRPVSQIYESEPGSLEAWLTERYALFQNVTKGAAIGIDIHHQKWQLQKAEAEIIENTLTLPAGIPLPDDQTPMFHFSAHIDVLVWALKPML